MRSQQKSNFLTQILNQTEQFVELGILGILEKLFKRSPRGRCWFIDAAKQFVVARQNVTRASRSFACGWRWKIFEQTTLRKKKDSATPLE